MLINHCPRGVGTVWAMFARTHTRAQNSLMWI